MNSKNFAAMLLLTALAFGGPYPSTADDTSAARSTSKSTAALLESFSWAGGIEDTFIPQAKPGFRRLEEYELTQHYEQWRDDLKRAASLGLTKLRWGVPWYRIEPKRGHYDWSFTDEVINYMVDELHIEPIVDLVHYGTPTWMEDSFVDPDYPERVSEYARAFAERYKDKVRYYTPLNEPGVNAEYCGSNGQWPPYLTGDKGYVSVLLPIARGVQLCGKAIRDADPDATLVAVEAMRCVEASDTSAVAVAAARQALDKDLLPWDLVSGKVDKQHPLYAWLIKNGAQEDDLEKLQDEGIHQDVLGVNFYPWSIKTIRDVNGKAVESDGPQRGRLLLQVLKRCWERAQTPIFVTETSSTGDATQRALWMSETIDAVRIARGAGIPVVGYTWFPLITMVDWQYRTSKKPLTEHLLHLGLWDSSFDGDGVLQRHETALVDNYRDWIKVGMSPTREFITVRTPERPAD